jgi:hypothetical protein
MPQERTPAPASRQRSAALRAVGEPNPDVVCACGCGQTFSRYDDFGRPRQFISGHNSKFVPSLDADGNVVPGQFRAFISRLSGRKLGGFKRAADMAGISFQEFIDRVDSGLKRCMSCKQWIKFSGFISDASRWDCLSSRCSECQRRFQRQRYEPVPPSEWKPKGPPRKEPRDGDKIQARHLINLDIRHGKRPDPDMLHCAYCGHKGTDRRHEYHHYMGYEARHHYDVIPICSVCHAQAH